MCHVVQQARTGREDPNTVDGRKGGEGNHLNRRISGKVSALVPSAELGSRGADAPCPPDAGQHVETMFHPDGNGNADDQGRMTLPDAGRAGLGPA